MQVETKRLLLRDFVPEDAADLYEILGDEETMKYCEPVYDMVRTEKFLTDFCIGRHGGVAAVCRALLDYAFGRKRARKVFAETIDAGRSVRLMEKLGMKREGLQRSQVKNPAGEWADLYLYGILREEKEGEEKRGDEKEGSQGA